MDTSCLLIVLKLQYVFLSGALSEIVRFSTYEEEPPGTDFGVLVEELQQLGLIIDGVPTGFRLMKQTGNSSLVRVRERDGQLSLGPERLDREQLCGQAEEPCLLPFDVVSLGGPRGSPSQYRLVHVELEVRDINDHAPRFPQPLIALEVSESAAPGTRLPLDLAQDLDVGSNGIQSFAVSPNSHFGLEVQSRADGLKCAELVLLTELDREAQAAYRLELVAKDGGSPARSGTATVSVRVLDANDNAPAFPHGALLTVELPEDTPPGSLLVDLDASDPDEGANGQLLYSWGSQVPAEARQLFGLDPLSGRLSLQGSVDYELQRAFELDVQASDRGASPLAASCKVVVRLLDVNDNAPAVAISALSAGTAQAAATAASSASDEIDVSAPTVAYVSEAAPAESLVALVSTSDSDAGANGQVRCALLAAPHEPFALQRAYDDSYVVLTTGALDRERVAEYNLTVVAEDLGSPPAKTVRRLTVRLADENDNAPRFAKARYEVAVLENNPPGAYLASVLASDPDLGPNGKVTYRLLERPTAGASSISQLFSVDPHSGVMRALRPLDYEQRRQLEMGLEACDGGTPRLCQRTEIGVNVVDQNDNPPQITFPLLVNGSADLPLPFSAPLGFLIARVEAKDADDGPNAEMTFSILGKKPVFFAVNSLTGEFFLRQLVPSSDLPEAGFVLVVAVEDGGRPSLTSTATLRLIPTDTVPSSVEIVALQPSSAEEEPWNLSLLLIGVLGAGCGLLLIAILLVLVSICKSKNFLGGMPHKPVCFKGEGRAPRTEKLSSGCVDTISTDLASSVSDDTSRAEDSGGTAASGTRKDVPSQKPQTQVLIPFHPSSIWKKVQSASSFSSHSTPDQMSVKDSGKGDSEYNDSDSDSSKEGLKKSLAEETQKQGGTEAIARDANKYNLLIHFSSRSNDSLFHYEHRDTISNSVAQMYSCHIEGRKNSFHPDFLMHRKDSSPVQTERLQSIYETVINRTTPVTPSRMCNELNYRTSQNCLSTRISEVATTF